MSTTDEAETATAETTEQEGSASSGKRGKPAEIILPNTFEAENHYYTKVINAQIHPLVSFFMSLSNDRIIERYCHLYPSVKKESLEHLLGYLPASFRWAGSDLFYVTEEKGGRKMVVIETNSCPSGQKSMPFITEHEETNGYRILIERTFKPLLERYEADGKLIPGKLAVVYDKNYMEAAGYAAVMAELFKEQVLLVEWYDNDPTPPLRWTDSRILQIMTPDEKWHDIRAAFRYVTQRPWKRIPVHAPKTVVFNPISVCLAGGRNKLVASKAYEFFNASHESNGLIIRCPETIRDLRKEEIPLWIKRFGGHAVIKVPYSNAGQGVYTITSPDELKSFMHSETGIYDQYIVQSLIGNFSWSSKTHQGQYFHVGTVPDKNKNIYCADIRMMVHFDMKQGCFRPLALYSRRAKAPLLNNIPVGQSSWEILGTNLSIKLADNTWSTDTSRLLIMDRRDFNRLGISIDDLIDAFIQTVMSTIAVDQLTKKLTMADGKWNFPLFSSLNKDDTLIAEIMV